MNRRHLTLSVLALGAVSTVAASANAAIIVKASADAQLNEQASETSGSNSGGGVGTSINSRTLSGSNNEVMVFRFDLSAYSMSTIAGATLNLINFRDNTTRTIHAYGVVDGTVGKDNAGTLAGYDDNNWSETAVRFSTMPGLDWDGDLTTGSLDTPNLVDLGTFGIVTGTSLKGTVNTFTDAAITSFLNLHPDNIVSIIVRSDTNSSGQARMATREATALDAGSPTGVAGDFAAYLSFNVPEPSSASLIAVGTLAMLRRRRGV